MIDVKSLSARSLLLLTFTFCAKHALAPKEARGVEGTSLVLKYLTVANQYEWPKKIENRGLNLSIINIPVEL